MRKRVFKKEADVKAAVKEIFSGAPNLWYFMPVPCGYGKAGVPDFIACCNGVFLAVETKYAGGRLSAHQKIEIKNILDKGGIALVIDESNLDSLHDAVQEIVGGNVDAAKKIALLTIGNRNMEV